MRKAQNTSIRQRYCNMVCWTLTTHTHMQFIGVCVCERYLNFDTKSIIKFGPRGKLNTIFPSNHLHFALNFFFVSENCFARPWTKDRQFSNSENCMHIAHNCDVSFVRSLKLLPCETFECICNGNFCRLRGNKSGRTNKVQNFWSVS